MASNVKKAFEEAGIDVPEVPTSGIAGTETTVPPSAPADATATATTPAPSVPAATDTTPTADKQPVVLSFGRVDREAAAKLREQKKTELEAIPSFVAELVVLLKNPREETILSMTDGTERSLTLEEFEAYIATVVNGTQHRGVRQSFTTAVVEQMLGQFPPSDHLFGVAFTRVSTALTDTDGRGFFFEVEKDWALKNPGNVIWMYRSDGSGKAPFASVAPDSTRLMIATKKWLDEIERAEKSRIKTGTKPFLEAFYQGGETAFFLKKKEIPRRDGGTIIRKAGHFRIHIEDGKNGRIRPVEALESPHHDLFEEMTSRREWVSIGVLAPEIVGADPENRQKMIAAYFRDVENYEQRKRFIRFAHIIIDGYIDALASEKKAAEAHEGGREAGTCGQNCRNQTHRRAP